MGMLLVQAADAIPRSEPARTLLEVGLQRKDMLQVSRDSRFIVYFLPSFQSARVQFCRKGQMLSSLILKPGRHCSWRLVRGALLEVLVSTSEFATLICQ